MDVGLHLPIQPGLLLLAHGWHGGDDDLGVLELDQVMKLHAGFLLTGVVPVEDGVSTGLDFGRVDDLVGVGRGGGRLVVDDFPALNQVEDTDQFRQAVMM